MHQDQTEDSPRIMGESEAIKEVIQLIDRLAPTSAIVLITGETGVGKDLVARTLHAKSKRKDKKFDVVNCALLNEEILQSELFGHEIGAYTDASSQHIGLFEQIDGGTLFLDEIGEMSSKVQAQLLRILDGQPFKRMGGTENIEVDVRIIAATNVNLLQAVRALRFRSDLYFRINVGRIHVPPLRDRRDDIKVLVNKFIPDLSTKNEIPKPNITSDAIKFLKNVDWPGNVRELENVIERSIILRKNEKIEIEDVQAAYLDSYEDSLASDYLMLLSTFISDLEAYFQNQGWQVNIQDLKEAIEGAIIQATRQYQQLKDSQPTPSSAWVEEFKNLLSDTQEDTSRQQNLERKIDTYVALITGIDDLKLNHLKKNMPYYTTSEEEESQYASVEALRGMYKRIIKPILEEETYAAILNDRNVKEEEKEVQDDINKIVIKQLRFLLLRVNPQLQLQAAKEAAEKANATRSPRSVNPEKA